MAVSVEKTSTLGRKLTIEVPADVIAKQEKKTIQAFVRDLNKGKVDGFRKGKVPESYVEKKFQKEIQNETLNKVLQTSLTDALKGENFNLANQPKIDDIKHEPQQDLSYTASFEVFPEVKLKDFSEITLEKPVADISDADIDSGVEKLQKQFATWKKVERVAKKEDKVIIDFVGSIDGVEFPGGKGDDMELELGSGQFIPGFEEGLIGAKSEEERTLDLSFPEDYHSKDFAGKKAQFKVMVKEVQEVELASLDNEFAKKIGIEDGDADKIRQQVKNNMEKYVADFTARKLRETALEKYAAAHKIDLPPSLVEQQKEALMKDKEHNHEHDDSGKCKLDSKEEAELTEEAEKAVLVGLLLNEIIKVNELKPDNKKIAEKINALAAMYGGANAQMIQKMYYESKELMQNVANMVLTDSAADLIVAGATIKEKKQKFYEIVDQK